jgi:hypothetical protein
LVLKVMSGCLAMRVSSVLRGYKASATTIAISKVWPKSLYRQ